MANISSTLGALADPTRFQVMERLRDGPKAVGEIATGLLYVNHATRDLHGA